MMNYDIVLVTYNRRLVLSVSIPLMLAQSRPPRNFILVDSSSDHELVILTVKEIFSKFGGNTELKILESKAGICVQRNVGLHHVKSEIVMFPDDDALWYPRYAESKMAIYERDREELIGGIPGEEVHNPPAAAAIQARLPYKMTWRDRAISSLSGPLRKLEVFPFLRETVFLEGEDRIRGKAVPSWLAENNAQLVGPMTGFTMSFRTSAINVHKFDENLGRYALFDDFDASLQVMKEKIMVKAKGAKVFHYKSPFKRTGGYEWGVITILNRAYVICKISKPGSRARRYLFPHSIYKCVRYLAQCNSKYGRERFEGAFFALKHVRSLLLSPPDMVEQTFIRVRESCLRRSN